MSKIIEVYPCAGKTPHTAPVWQYDYGQNAGTDFVFCMITDQLSGIVLLAETWNREETQA